MSKRLDKYVEGTDMSLSNHLTAVSVYNHNYHEIGGDLLYAVSDDDNETEWYLIVGTQKPVYLGYTYTSENDEYLRKGGGRT